MTAEAFVRVVQTAFPKLNAWLNALPEVKAMLAAQHKTIAPEPVKQSGLARKSPKAVVPLDHDARGYGNF